jgi:hypothetical protein
MRIQVARVIALGFSIFGAGVPAAVPVSAQNASVTDIRITRAIFGAAQGSADVTPVVTRLVAPGASGLYAAPQWLEVGPASGQTKELVVFYEYRGAPHVLTVTEPYPLTHEILAAHANPSARSSPPAGGGPLAVVEAHYGMGRTFSPVTARVSDLIRPDAPPSLIDDGTFGMTAVPQGRVLIVTYTFGGDRHTAVMWRGTRLSYEDLERRASAGNGPGTYTDRVPEWLSTARPDPPRQPGVPEPGAGLSPRRELGIAELLKGLAELRAIAPLERTAGVSLAIAETERAIGTITREMSYPFPVPGASPYQPLNDSTAIHIAKAMASLNSATTHLGAAATGRRGNPPLSASLAAIRSALQALNP